MSFGINIHLASSTNPISKVLNENLFCNVNKRLELEDLP